MSQAQSVERLRVAKVPQPLMRGDEAFHASTPIPVPGSGTPGYHDLKHLQQLIRYLQVSRVACVMEGHQHLVRQTARVTRETWRIS